MSRVGCQPEYVGPWLYVQVPSEVPLGLITILLLLGLVVVIVGTYVLETVTGAVWSICKLLLVKFLVVNFYDLQFRTITA